MAARTTRHEIYAAALAALDLRPEAHADLSRRGLTDDDIADCLFRSIPRKGTDLAQFKALLMSRFGELTLRACPGFTDKNERFTFWSAAGARDGYVIPYIDEQGRITGLQMKELGGTYVTARGARVADIYHLAGERVADLYLTEGGLKAEVSARSGYLWVFGIPGQALQPEHVDVIRRLAPERAIVALDREANLTTDRMRDRWLSMLSDGGLHVFDAVWEES